MSRPFLTRTQDGKVRLWLGREAAQEKRRVARRVDRAIVRALSGKADDSERRELELMADLAAWLGTAPTR
jgi:hypothetical protein